MQESKLLGAARMALECLEPTRKRRWGRTFVLAELRSAIAEEEGKPITLEEAGYDEGQAEEIRLMVLAREMLTELRAALPVLRAFRDSAHDARRGSDDPALAALVRRVESIIVRAKGGDHA